MDEALGECLPGLAGAAAAADAHAWPLPAGGAGATVFCRVVPVDRATPWGEVRDWVASAAETAGGRLLWSEPIAARGSAERPATPGAGDAGLRLDVGLPGLPTHTLVLYRAGDSRPRVRWGNGPAATAWRQLQARATTPVVALVIDDWGYRNDDTTRGLLALDVPLTLSILPGLAHSRRFAAEGTELALPPRASDQAGGPGSAIADRRRAAGCPVTFTLEGGDERLDARRREIFLHLPMQPEGYPEVDPGPRAVLIGMPRERIAELLDVALADLPGVRGVNNHMGSAATADRGTMADLMAALKARDLTFLDSLTAAASVAYEAALAAGVPAARNRIFLDDDHQDPESVRSRLRSLVRSARTSGFAVGIGHPHPETLAVLQEELPRLEAAGVCFVTLSELLALQGRAPTNEPS
ncbi:MAG TPA: divergent polysaccharide deacetylase family protein [Candidatus Krumholzibacteria bacterium]|nr:divergent polysaccharide deacetylase family protein [Candidatus Krumholzibacteria bacterium]HPD72332.1 divergent polysaccharide deacetylase family protein [Candidatus Krumholzibacteria bacterium]HRY40736.1 divergent polysaccharide deacetylase family protein [Candidatus Krumholzibacteria bacterium]